MSKEDESLHKKLWRWETVSLAILVLGMASLGLIVGINYVWEEEIQDFVVVDAATDLRNDLTSFHLWFEEYINGDDTIDPEKNRELFVGAKKLARALLIGGKTQSGFVLRPLDTPQLREKAEALNTLLDSLEDRGVVRLREKSLSRSGSPNDQAFDKIFGEIISLATEIEDSMEKDIVRSMQQFQRLYLVILVVWAVIISGTTVGVGALSQRRRRSVHALRESQEMFQSLVNSTEDSIYLVDAECNYLFVNKRHLKRLGMADNSLNGRNYADFHTPEEMAVFRKRVDRVISTRESAQYEHQSLRDSRYFIQTFSPVMDTDGRISAVTVVSKNISERRQMEDDLRALSLTDELTGLYNRRGFFTLAAQQLKIATRMNKKLCLVLADLDDLKVINDTFGHHEGDSALVETANILRESFRESDIIARIGGDEFVVMPIEMTDDRAAMILLRLNQGFEKGNEKNRLRYRISISTGITMFDPAMPASIEEMLKQADDAMYEQKKLKKLCQGQTRNGLPQDEPS